MRFSGPVPPALGGALGSLLLASTMAAAQPAPSRGGAEPAASPPNATASPPPGLVPVFPPGAGPNGPAPAPPAGTSPPAAGGWPTYPPGYGVPGYYPPPGYGYYPQPYYTPGMALLPPSTLPYEEGQTVPSGYKLKTRPMRSLVVSGSITFGTTYLTSLLVAATVLAGSASDGKQFAPLFAPAIGPFIAIATTKSSGVGTLWLVLDGVAQTSGMVLLVYGLMADEKYLERAATGHTSLLDGLAHPQVFVGPRSGVVRWTL